jgi:hypothetical protein
MNTTGRPKPVAKRRIRWYDVRSAASRRFSPPAAEERQPYHPSRLPKERPRRHVAGPKRLAKRNATFTRTGVVTASKARSTDHSPWTRRTRTCAACRQSTQIYTLQMLKLTYVAIPVDAGICVRCATTWCYAMTRGADLRENTRFYASPRPKRRYYRPLVRR